MGTIAARQRRRGFTLIELLVAIALMALMSVLAWRGLDGIGRAQRLLAQRADDGLALQATLAQWGADLDAIEPQPGLTGLDWDGRVLRILRRSSSGTDGDGLLVVAWTQRAIDGQGWWLRWQSPPLNSRDALDLAWQRAAVWAQTPSDDDRLREVRTVPIDQWQLYYYRNNAWSNPLSSAGTRATATLPQTTASAATTATPATAATASPELPDGVRLVLTLSGGQALAGTLTRDWAQPILGASK